MTRQYTFNFDNFTVGHVMVLHSGDVAAQVAAIHELTEGGIRQRDSMRSKELIEAQRQRMVEHVAYLYGVDIEKVTYIGEIESPRLRYICRNHSAPLHPYNKKNDPYLWMMPPMVDFEKQFEYVDNILHLKNKIYLGQCPDCGQVYMAEQGGL